MFSIEISLLTRERMSPRAFRAVSESVLVSADDDRT